jgi:hypothetical protein
VCGVLCVVCGVWWVYYGIMADAMIIIKSRKFVFLGGGDLCRRAGGQQRSREGSCILLVTVGSSVFITSILVYNSM